MYLLPIMRICFQAAIQYLRTNCLQAIDLLPLDRLRQQRQRSSSNNNDQQGPASEGGSFFEPPDADALPPQCRWAVDCVACDTQLKPVVEVRCHLFLTLRHAAVSGVSSAGWALLLSALPVPLSPAVFNAKCEMRGIEDPVVKVLGGLSV